MTAMFGEMQHLDSDFLMGGRYDADAQRLVLDFRDGTRFEYSGVPQDTADALFAADSHGKFFHRQIKGRYSHKKLL